MLILDVDGVVVNYFEGLIRYLDLKGMPSRIGWRDIRDYGLSEIFPDGMSYEERLVHVRDFAVSPAFGSLKIAPNVVVTVRWLRRRFRNLEIVAVTSAGDDPVTEILRRRNLAALELDALHMLPLCGSKLDAYSQFAPGCVVVDDLPENLAASTEAGHKAILFRQNWNSHVTSYPVIESWIGKRGRDLIVGQLDIKPSKAKLPHTQSRRRA